MILTREGIQRMIDGVGNGAAGGGGGDFSALLAGYATESWVDENYLSIEFFSKLFKAYNSANPAVEIKPNDTQSTITNIKAMFGFWTEQYLSALGQNAGGGGGGVGDVTWDALADNTDTRQIALSHLTTALSGYATQSWVNTQGYLTAITSSQIISALGYTPANNADLSNYLPLSGGTLTSNDNTPLNIVSKQANCYFLLYTQSQNINTLRASVGYYNNFAFLNCTGNARLGITSTGNPEYWVDDNTKYTLIHTGNIGSYNAGSATKLQTARTIWGRSFDGTADISGRILVDVFPTNEDGIYFRTQSIDYLTAKYNLSILIYKVGNTAADGLSINGYSGVTICTGSNTRQERFRVDYNGNVGIGTTSPSYKLHVEGSIYAASGIITNGSVKIGDIFLGYDATNNAIKVYKLDANNQPVAANLYATGGISALGYGVSGGGGAGDVTWDALESSTDERPISISHLTGALAGYALTSQLAGYLPLTGGTISTQSMPSGANAILTISTPTQSNDWGMLLILLSSGIQQSHHVAMEIGRHLSQYNTGVISFYNAGDSSSSNRMDFGLYGTQTYLSILGSGNVGIGTTNPSSRLEVNGLITAKKLILVDTDTNPLSLISKHTDTECYALFYTQDAQGVNNLRASVGYYNSFAFINTGSYRLGLTSNGNPEYWADATGTTRYTLIHTGNISTTNVGSATKLQTARTLWGRSFDGTANVSGYIFIDAYSENETGIYFRFATPGTSYKYNSSIISYDHNDGGVTPDGLSINGFDGVSICTGSNTRNERMRIAENGNVGIGTTSPSYLLHVNGSIYGSSFIKSGGTSSQFLKADGSVDSTAYLPLTGGTITGASMSTSTGVLNVISAATGVDYSYILKLLNSGQEASRHISIGFGKEFSNYNCAVLTYYHVGNGSTSNRFNIGLYGTVDILTVIADGKVGILNTSPSYALDVSGDVRATNFRGALVGNASTATKLETARAIWGRSFDGTADISGYIVINAFAQNESGIYFREGFTDASNKYNTSIISYDHNGSGNTPDGISINAYDGISFCTGGNTRNERARFTSSGYFGINTTSPSYRLHVVGDVYASSVVYANQGVELNTGTYSSSIGGYIDFHYGGTSNDYSVRLIEETANILSIDAKQVGGTASGSAVRAGLVVGGGQNASYIQIGNGRIVWDSTNQALRVTSADGTATNLYATGGVSALGMNTIATDGTVGATLVPSTTATYDLGSSSYKWRDLYMSGRGTNFSIINYSSYTYFGTSNYFNFGADILIEYNGLHIGTRNTNYDLYVNGENGGNGYFVGNVSAASITNRSDMRLKNVLADLKLSVDSVANAPLFLYTFKNGKGQVMAGTSAQYWNVVLPQTVFTDPEGMMSLDYGVTALAGVISVAREVSEHERRIAKLEAENATLRAEIEDLKAA